MVSALLFSVLAVFAQWQDILTTFFTTHEKTGITPEVRRFVEELRKNGTIPGLSVAVIHTEGKDELEGFGISTEDGGKLVPETLFNIASCSKAFLAGSVGILIDDFAHGRNVTPLPSELQVFDWHTKVRDLLPNDWRLMDEWASEKASIRDILSHASGIPRHDLSYGPSDSPADLIHRLRHLRPSFELRERFQYNNQMYILTSHIVSLYSGKPYIEFVKERVFTPLNMSTTTFSEFEASQTGLLTHSFNAVGRRLPFWFPDSVKVLNAGAGGIISSTRDLAKWVRMLLNGGVNPVTNQIILTASTIEATTSAHSIVSQPPFPEFSLFGYGLGWFKYSYQGHEILQHAGAIPGFSTQVAFLPHDGVGVVVLLNASDKRNQTEAILYHIIETLLDLPHIASSRYADKQTEDSYSIPSEDLPLASPLSQSTIAVTTAASMSSRFREFPLEKYVGTYTNPGYHNISICSPRQRTNSSTPSPICRDTLSDFSDFDDFSSTSNSTLYLAIHNTWVRNARIVRSPDHPHRFSMVFTYLFPHGYGKNKSAFELDEMGEFSGDAQFVVEMGKVVGFGMNNSDVREVTERQRRGRGVKEMAGVWFEKL